MLPLAFDRICNEVLEGKVALMDAPPNRNLASAEVKRWMINHSLFRPFTKSAILDRCMEAFNDAYASVAQSSWLTSAKNNVLGDLRRMQCQPALVDDYRRFVVVDVGTVDTELRDGVNTSTLVLVRLD